MTNDDSDSDTLEFKLAYRKTIEETERKERAESRRIFAEAEAFQLKKMEEDKKHSSADCSYGEAVEYARFVIKQEELNPEIKPYCEIRYTVAQGLKAAINGREDGAATLVLQRDILIRLDAIKVLLWVVVALLAFVAYKLA